MKHRKVNTPVYLTLGLCTVLMVFCLMLATGTTFARYRVDTSAAMAMEARPRDQVLLGKWETDPQTGKTVFDTETQNTWKTVDGTTALEFSVSNGTDEETFAYEDLKVYVRLVASLDIRYEGTGPVVKLVAPSQEEEGEQVEYTGKPERIPEGTQLHLTFGDGWIYRFYDEKGEEVYQTLPGGVLSGMDMKLVLEENQKTYSGLLQLQVTADYIIR